MVNLNLPDFILSVWRQIIQGSDVEPELFALREFAETGSKGNEIFSGDIGSLLEKTKT